MLVCSLQAFDWETKTDDLSTEIHLAILLDLRGLNLA